MQAEKHSIYTEFADFFEKEIKYQGVKGNWIFRLNEILGLHKFDYNNDGFMDNFIEFNAISVEGEATIYRYSVLFKNEENKKNRFVNFIECNNRHFLKFEDNHFIFLHTSTTNAIEVVQRFLLRDGKFLLMH